MEKENVISKKSFSFSCKLPGAIGNVDGPMVLRGDRHTAPRRHLLMRHVSDALDSRLDAWSERVISSVVLNPMDIYPPNLPSAESVWCVGRVIQLGIVWWLETSRQVGSGVRVPLDLGALSQWSLFTGQLVCVRGINPDGKLFRVQELVDVKTMPRALTADNSRAKICVMMGPFNDLDLFDRLAEKLDRTWTLILGGPFATIDTLLMPSQQWAKLMPRLQRISVEQMILIPSLDDAGHDHVFPQCHLHLALPNVLLAGNPCNLAKGDLNLSISTMDTLQRMSLRLQESHPQPDRLNRLASLITAQSSWYPWDPPLPDDPVDPCRWDDLLIPPSTTHLIISPSPLKPIATTCHGKLFINPGKSTPLYLEILSNGTIRTIY